MLYLLRVNDNEITYPQRHICRRVNRVEESMDHLKGKYLNHQVIARMI